MRNSNYIVYDVETGGLKDDENPILEVAMFLVDSKSFKILDRLEYFIKPYCDLKITQGALNANGINMSEVLSEGLDYKVAYKQTAAFLKKCNAGKTAHTRPILVGHNVPFDNGFMDKLFSLAGKDTIWNYVTKQFVCTQLETKKLEILPNLKLATCCEHFGIELINAHRAGADTEATVKLLQALINRMRNGGSNNSKSTEEKKVEKSRVKFQF